MIQAIKHST